MKQQIVGVILSLFTMGSCAMKKDVRLDSQASIVQKLYGIHYDATNYRRYQSIDTRYRSLPVIPCILAYLLGDILMCTHGRHNHVPAQQACN